MHKQRIIDGIEKVFEGYAKDGELRGALRASYSRSNTRLQLFPKDLGSHFLREDGTIWVKYDDIRGYGSSSPRAAAQAYFDYFRFRCKPPFTVTKAKAMLAEDLGARVEKLKRAYARHFDNECDRLAEGRYVQHPDA